VRIYSRGAFWGVLGDGMAGLAKIANFLLLGLWQDYITNRILDKVHLNEPTFIILISQAFT
jgi:hypothetical protein